MKNNVASRLHVVLVRWQSYQDSEPALKGWSKALQIKMDDGIQSHLAIYHKIGILVGELDHLNDQLAASQHSSEIYGPPLQKVGRALSPALFHLKCSHVKQYLTPDVITALGFCSEMLPDEEEAISEDDFRALVGLIHELELVLQDSTLPGSLVALIRRHIMLAETAIADYPLRGAASLKDAVKAAVGDLAIDASAIVGWTPEAVSALRTLWERVNKVADVAIKVDGLLQAGTRVGQLLEKFLA